ncbi:MAG: phage holin family protein [Verrucomicrobiota bacterium]
MMGTTLPPNGRPATEAGLSGHLLALLASLAGYLRARLELAGIEGKDAAGIYLKVAIILVMVATFLVFGYAFLWIGLIALIAAFAHVDWGWLVLAAGVLHLLGALGGGWAVLMLWKKPVFAATLEEFRKDQEWLKSHK